MQNEQILNTTSTDQARFLVEQFWQLMASNDFFSVSAVLSEDFVLEWPQSGERIRGAENFAKMNAEYPAHGPWIFTVHQIVAEHEKLVSDVSITDGVQRARALSFFIVANGKIQKIVEFWPDPFVAPENRRHLVEIMA
jgi:ketosteroid isomerase-like protein